MAINLNIYNTAGEKIESIELSDKVFGLKANKSLIHQVVVGQMANERQVLAHTKDRSEVRGGGKKPWKQKGTGRARAGSSRSPIWIGGGVTFGPLKDRNFKKKINKKMKQRALMMLMSDKVRNDNFIIIEKVKLDEYKTKVFNGIIKNFETKVFHKNKDLETGKKFKRSILFINDEKDEKLKYSSRNLVGIKTMNLENINLVDLLKYKKLIVSKKALEIIEKKYN